MKNKTKQTPELFNWAQAQGLSEITLFDEKTESQRMQPTKYNRSERKSISSWNSFDLPENNYSDMKQNQR